MRIEDVGKIPQSIESTPPGRTKSLENSASALDHSQISLLAAQIGAAGSDRVEQLRLSVQNGTYEVSPDALAASIIDAHAKPPSGSF